MSRNAKPRNPKATSNKNPTTKQKSTTKKATPSRKAGTNDHDPVLAAPLQPTAGPYSAKPRFLDSKTPLNLEQPVAPSTLKPKNPGTGKK